MASAKEHAAWVLGKLGKNRLRKSTAKKLGGNPTPNCWPRLSRRETIWKTQGSCSPAAWILGCLLLLEAHLMERDSSVPKTSLPKAPTRLSTSPPMA